MTSTDRIERSITLKAPLERVWRALSNAEEFGNEHDRDRGGERFDQVHPAFRLEPIDERMGQSRSAVLNQAGM